MTAIFGLDPESLTLNTMIDVEVARGLTDHFGEKHNKKTLDKSKKSTWEWTYSSTAINVKLMWQITFLVTKLLYNLIAKQEMTLVQACQDAYSTAYKEIHSSMVRKAAALAIKSVG